MWRPQGGRDLDSWGNCTQPGTSKCEAPEEADRSEGWPQAGSWLRDHCIPSENEGYDLRFKKKKNHSPCFVENRKQGDWLKSTYEVQSWCYSVLEEWGFTCRLNFFHNGRKKKKKKSNDSNPGFGLGHQKEKKKQKKTYGLHTDIFMKASISNNNSKTP